MQLELGLMLIAGLAAAILLWKGIKMAFKLAFTLVALGAVAYLLLNYAG